MVAVKVVDMEDSHIFRWVQYFRRKYRNEGLVGTDDQIDAGIRMRIVTAPAIYAEALRRGMAGPLGLNALHVLGAQPVKPVKPVQPGLPDLTIPDQAGLDESILAPGVRRITLDED
jgi:hypothetical protein